MGVELRSIQRKFHGLMDELKPQIRPRFVVWLDERLAEFKVKGTMELSETLDDPQWIKDYYTSKRESKAAAIKEREARNAAGMPASSLVQPKLEEKSESSNGLAHPDEVSEGKEEEDTISRIAESQPPDPDPPEQAQAAKPIPKPPTQPTQPSFQLVEVKSEQMEDDDDDDMIIVGETLAPPPKQYQQYNPMRQMYGFGARNVGPFQRKRQRFGSINRPMKSRLKPNFRSLPSASSTQSSFPSHTATSFPSHTATSFPSHTATSQSLYTSTPSSQSFQEEYTDDDSSSYQEQSESYPSDPASQSFPSELLRIPPHLQAQASALEMQENVDYEVTEGDMYAEYGDESYDSSYVEGDSSLMYDEDGNAVIKGEGAGGEEGMEPLPGTSGEGSSQDDKFYSQKTRQNVRIVRETGSNSQKLAETKNPVCPYCSKKFAHHYSLKRHISYTHTGKPAHTCKICSKRCHSRGDLMAHRNVSHLKVKPFVCECGQRYSYKRTLKVHKQNYIDALISQQSTTNPTPYACCDLTFRTYRRLLSHKDQIHSNIPEGICWYCMNAFSFKNDLRRHIDSVHSQVSRCYCFCGKMISRKDNFRTHLALKQCHLKYR